MRLEKDSDTKKSDEDLSEFEVTSDESEGHGGKGSIES